MILFCTFNTVDYILHNTLQPNSTCDLLILRHAFNTMDYIPHDFFKLYLLTWIALNNPLNFPTYAIIDAFDAREGLRWLLKYKKT